MWMLEGQIWKGRQQVCGVSSSSTEDLWCCVKTFLQEVMEIRGSHSGCAWTFPSFCLTFRACFKSIFSFSCFKVLFLMGEFQRPTFPLSPLTHKDSSDLVQCLLCQTIVSFDWFLNFIRLWSSASLLGHSWLDLSISGSLSLYGSSQVVELDTSTSNLMTCRSYFLFRFASLLLPAFVRRCSPSVASSLVLTDLSSFVPLTTLTLFICL